MSMAKQVTCFQDEVGLRLEGVKVLQRHIFLVHKSWSATAMPCVARSHTSLAMGKQQLRKPIDTASFIFHGGTARLS
jgi:hypothetical protein